MKNPDEMEMPCPCQKCGEWFDLNDGSTSKLWFPDTVICASCGNLEDLEIERDIEIEEMTEQLQNAIYDLKEAQKRLTKVNHSWDENEAYLEHITQHNMEVVGSFIKHLKAEAGINIPEKHFLSFFNA